VLPGVGAFGACMQALRAAGLDPWCTTPWRPGRPFMGICVGMQMLFSCSSEEDPDDAGLGVIRSIRWITVAGRGRRCSGTSWICTSRRSDVRGPRASYDGVVNAAFRSGNVFATQFHPEKSGPAGLALLRNFVQSGAGLRRGAGMILYPAIDLRGGRCVRLYQGDYDRETTTATTRSARPGPSPRPARRGSTWSTSTLLAAARRPTATSSPRSARRSTCPCNRAAASARSPQPQALADAGVARVVIGTAALEQPGLVADRRPPERRGCGGPRRPRATLPRTVGR
jgi:glutamine amidotransferase